MARIIDDDDDGDEQPNYSDSGGFNGRRFGNGSYLLLIIIALLLLFFWADLPRLGNNVNGWLRGNPNSTSLPVEGSITRENTGIMYVIAESPSLRAEPSNLARVSYLLPRGSKVALLGESHQEPGGDLWLKVKAESLTGMQIGWVRQLWLERNQSAVRTPPVKRPTTVPRAETRRITADNLDLREEPTSSAWASYSLPRGTKVTLLGDTHQEPDGEVWLKVRVETRDGKQVGWVNQQYLE